MAASSSRLPFEPFGWLQQKPSNPSGDSAHRRRGPLEPQGRRRRPIPRLSVVGIPGLAVLGVLPTVVSPGAIWAEVEPGFHIELETAIWVDVLPDKRRDGAQVRRRQPPSSVRPSLTSRIRGAVRFFYGVSR